MSDKGIIFSAPMVRALLDGRKTQTRRLLKGAPEGNWHCDRGAVGLRWVAPGGAPSMPCKVAYERADRLYVREAWSVRGVYSDVVEVGYRASERRGHTEYVEQWPVARAVPGKGAWPRWPKYGPSILMPRWASRLWLAVTDVRVQRLQNCSEADAIAEGLVPYRLEGPGGSWITCWHWLNGVDDEAIFTSPVAAYRALWNSLHTAEGERWQDNPWVVAVGFDLHRGNIDGADYG